MPWLKTGAPKTIGCVPQFILLSTRSVIASLVPILPEWPSASFWPFLRERSSQFKSFVVDVFVLPAINDPLLEGPGQRQIHASPADFCFSELPEVQNADFALGF